MKNMYDIRMLCKVVNLHHSVYYYHKQNRKNSYKTANIELDKKIRGLKFRGSANQRVIDVQKSLKEGGTILYE